MARVMPTRRGIATNNTEDYRGPAKSGYFQWMADPETGEMKPVSRLKGAILSGSIREM